MRINGDPMSDGALAAGRGRSKATVTPVVQRVDVGYSPPTKRRPRICSHRGSEGAEAVIYAVIVAVAGVDLMRPG